MDNKQSWTAREILFGVAAITFVLLLHGAVPFYLTPGQAVWTTGFAQSFANGPWYNIYAHDFGNPEPAAIAYGLSGAWPTSLLIRLGLHPADAYAGMNAIWLLIAFAAAVKLARLMGASRSISLLGGLVWMSMPIIWVHAYGFAMLSLGIALLPFYFLFVFKLFEVDTKGLSAFNAAICYLLSTITAIFMDGYTFMMFAVGSSILIFFKIGTEKKTHPNILRIAVPIHASAFLVAYALYAVYVGRTSYDVDPIDVFRTFGIDLSFIAIPTKGVHWFIDSLGLSIARSSKFYFGQSPVWTTTFALPIILVGFLAWIKIRYRVKIATGILLIAVFGFYMALGPTLKINATKPDSLQLGSSEISALMPPQYGIMPTGNAWISEKIPGFNVMRASYRWTALGVFALWILSVIWLAGVCRQRRIVSASLLLALIVLNMPHLDSKIKSYKDIRKTLFQIDRDLTQELKSHVNSGEKVAFVPWGNDFMANYLAPRAGFKALNIGGDKNLYAAQEHWPGDMMKLKRPLGPGSAVYVARLLMRGSVEVFILPYFHMLWAPNVWPCPKVTSAQLPEFICPDQRRAELTPFVHSVQSLPFLDFQDSSLFAIIRLKPEFAGNPDNSLLNTYLLSNVQYPIYLDSGHVGNAVILSDGWYDLEIGGVWSGAEARLMLPVPADCLEEQCQALLKFDVFGVSSERPVTIKMTSWSGSSQWEEDIVLSSSAGNQIKVPLGNPNGSQEVVIAIPDATSPQQLKLSPDNRILGIALQSIELLDVSNCPL